MNFVTIDFETANEKRNSPCSLGLTIVKENKIVDELYWLIRPKELRFMPINIMIHGIRPSDVEMEKEFDELWPEILPYLENNLVLAHNASFDMSVLRNTLDTYQIPYPKLSYACTMAMSKQYYPFLENSKLNTVNHYLGYDFAHHHASADASACANILLHILSDLQTDDIKEVMNTLGLSLGNLNRRAYHPCKKIGPSIIADYRPCDLKPHMVIDNTRLLGEVVALTGPLKSMTRYEAIDRIYELGGIYASSVTKKTTLVITNAKSPERLSPNQMSTKLRKAFQLKEKGQAIRIGNEDILL